MKPLTDRDLAFVGGPYRSVGEKAAAVVKLLKVGPEHPPAQSLLRFIGNKGGDPMKEDVALNDDPAGGQTENAAADGVAGHGQPATP